LDRTSPFDSTPARRFASHYLMARAR
jgi:hypothetical protein